MQLGQIIPYPFAWTVIELFAHFIPKTAATALRSIALTDIIQNRDLHNLYAGYNIE